MMKEILEELEKEVYKARDILDYAHFDYVESISDDETEIESSLSKLIEDCWRVLGLIEDEIKNQERGQTICESK